MGSKPLARLHVRSSGLRQPPDAVLHVPDWAPVRQPQIFQAHMDAGAHDCFVTTALVDTRHPALNQSCAYNTLRALRSLLAGLTVTCDGLQVLASTATSEAKLEISLTQQQRFGI